jgi:hypothetical protein
MIQSLRQTVIQRYWEEFDTSDQDAWDDLRNRLEEAGGVEIADYPTKAPEDPATWFELYKQLYYGEYVNQDEDYWVSDIKGFTEYEYSLTNEKGDEVISE